MSCFQKNWVKAFADKTEKYWWRSLALASVLICSVRPTTAAAATSTTDFPVWIELDKPQLVTVVIEDAAGQRVCNLVSETQLPAGQNRLSWDGFDDGNRNAEGDLIRKRVAPGTYRARGLSHDGIKTIYEFTTYSGGNPAWPNQQRTGGWLADHSPPMSALFLPAGSGSPHGGGASQVLLSALVAEAGAPFVWVGTDGTTYQRNSVFGWDEWFMAECVKAYLRYDPTLGPSPAEDWVQTYEVGKDVLWADGKLQLDFAGSRVEAICKSGSAAPAAVRIDGRKPSEFAELYGFTRAVTKPQGKWLVKWPVIAPITSEQPLLLEDWTLEARKDPENHQFFTFTISGSKTGLDGEGRSDVRFVSKSGRVVIETNDWNVAYAMSLAGIKPVPDHFTVRWKVEPNFADELTWARVQDSVTETAVTLAQGLSNTNHTLEIFGGDTMPIAAIRIYHPPLGRK